MYWSSVTKKRPVLMIRPLKTVQCFLAVRFLGDGLLGPAFSKIVFFVYWSATSIP